MIQCYDWNVGPKKKKNLSNSNVAIFLLWLCNDLVKGHSDNTRIINNYRPCKADAYPYICYKDYIVHI